MYRCRHEQDEDHYANRAENRRRNRDRINREVALHDNLTRIMRGGNGPPSGGHLGMPGHPYGLGSGGHGFGPSLSTYGEPHGYPGFPGPWGPGFYPPPYDDDSDSDDKSPSPWYPSPPPPYYRSSTMCTSRRSLRSLCGRRHGRGLRNPWADAFENDYYRHLPRSFFPHRGMRY